MHVINAAQLKQNPVYFMFLYLCHCLFKSRYFTVSLFENTVEPLKRQPSGKWQVAV